MPTSYFDRTPVGRILTRFTHDVDQIDTTIAAGVEEQLELM